MLPAPHTWVPWNTPNKKAVIEQYPVPHLLNLPLLTSKLRTSYTELNSGVRILIFNDEDKVHESNIDVFMAQDSMIGKQVKESLDTWKSISSLDRDVVLICPTKKHGTRQLNVDFTELVRPYEAEEGVVIPVDEYVPVVTSSMPIYMLDSGTVITSLA